MSHPPEYPGVLLDVGDPPRDLRVPLDIPQAQSTCEEAGGDDQHSPGTWPARPWQHQALLARLAPVSPSSPGSPLLLPAPPGAPPVPPA